MTRLLPPLRTLLPAEHGSWFMLGFPMALGLALRPSAAGAALAGAAAAFFLARPPLRRVLTGQRDGAQVRALLLLLGLAGLLGGCALLISGFRFLIPLALVSPLVALALWADQQRAVRSLAVEWAAQGAFAGLAATMLVAAGAGPAEAGRAWLFTTLVGCANLAHVRRLLGHAHRLEDAELRRRALPVHATHAALLGAAAALLLPRGWAGVAFTAWAALLYGRALLPYRPLPARILGWREGGLSVLSLLALVLALRS